MGPITFDTGPGTIFPTSPHSENPKQKLPFSRAEGPALSLAVDESTYRCLVANLFLMAEAASVPVEGNEHRNLISDFGGESRLFNLVVFVFTTRTKRKISIGF